MRLILLLDNLQMPWLLSYLRLRAGRPYTRLGRLRLTKLRGAVDIAAKLLRLWAHSILRCARADLTGSSRVRKIKTTAAVTNVPAVIRYRKSMVGSQSQCQCWRVGPFGCPAIQRGKGKIENVADYCEIGSYQVWLRYELFR